MKKTLFLSAILGAALCSSAFGAVTDISVGENETRDISDDIKTGPVSLTLADGATVTNTSAWYSNGSGGWGKQITSLTMTGTTATLDVTGAANTSGVGLVRNEGTSVLEEVSLNLNGGTLVKKGVGQTLMYHVTAASAGTIQVDAGRLLFDGKSHAFSGSNVDFVVNDGGAVYFNNLNTTMKSLTVNNGGSIGASGNSSGITVETINVASGVTTNLGNFNLTVKNSGTINSLSVNRLIYGTSATRVALSGTNTMKGMLDLSTSSGTFAGDLLLKEGASLTQDGTLWLRSTSKGILLEKGASYTHGVLTLTGLSSDTESLGQLVIATGSGTYDMALDPEDTSKKATDMELRNVAVQINTAWSGDNKLENKLVNSTLSYNNTNRTLTLNHAGNTLTGITMLNGSALQIDGGSTTLNGTGSLNDLNVTSGSFNIDGGTTTVAGNVTGTVTLNNKVNLSIAGSSIGTVKGNPSCNSTLTLNGNSAVEAYDILQDADWQNPGHLDLLLENGALTKVTHWLTVNSIKVSDGSNLSLANYNIKEMTINGTSVVSSNDGKGIGSGNHTMGAVTIASGASLTFDHHAAATIGALTMGAESSITVGSEESHKFNLTTTGLTVNGDANINADLVMNSGTLTFKNGAILTMGCDVTIGNDVTVVLTDAMVESIMNGNDVEIIAGVDKAYLSQSLTFIGSGSMSDYVTEHEGVYALKQVGDKIYITPEPATATLSLLALAALAARRKRH